MKYIPIVAIALAVVIICIALIVILQKKRREERHHTPAHEVTTRPAGPTGRRADLRVQYADPDRQRTMVDSVLDEGGAVSPLAVGAAQTIGAREDQEDSYTFTDWRSVRAINRNGFMAVLADGIGGLADGEVASQAAMRGALEAFESQSTNDDPAQRALEITAAAQRKVLEEGGESGSTFLCALIDDLELSIASVGDSRIMLYRGGVLLQLNREHVLGREIDEMNALTGDTRVESDQRRKAITAYLGKRELRTVDRTLRPMQLLSGDRVLLMSDGVFNTLSDNAIVAYMHMEPQTAAEEIIHAVNEKAVPGQDNATIIVVGVV